VPIPDEVVVTVGSQQALDLITRIFVDPGDVVLAEAPSYVGALGAFAAYQAEVVHVAMDESGIIPEALWRPSIAWLSRGGGSSSCIRCRASTIRPASPWPRPGAWRSCGGRAACRAGQARAGGRVGGAMPP
jgi:hypothetical protein